MDSQMNKSMQNIEFSPSTANSLLALEAWAPANNTPFDSPLIGPITESTSLPSGLGKGTAAEHPGFLNVSPLAESALSGNSMSPAELSALVQELDEGKTLTGKNQLSSAQMSEMEKIAKQTTQQEQPALRQLQ